MEYYQGMLFLTTNRVGKIDEAFMSRILLPLEYKVLTEDLRQKIWDSFIVKMEDTIPRLHIEKKARDFIRTDKELKLLQMNGREIRNGKLKHSVLKDDINTSSSIANVHCICSPRGG